MLQYKSGFYVVSTYHQIKDFEPEYIGIHSGRDHSYVTGGALYWDDRVNGTEPDDAFDIAVIDYTKPVEAGLIDGKVFAPDFGIEFLRQGDPIQMLLIVGFADSDQSNDTVEDADGCIRLDHMMLSKRIISCSYSGDSYQTEIFKAEMHLQCGIDLNGFSGSPVFAICGNVGEYCVKLAGIVLRAGGGHFHCLKHTRIRRLLDFKA